MKYALKILELSIVYKLVVYVLKVFSKDVVICFHELDDDRFRCQLDVLLKIYSAKPLKDLLDRSFGVQSKKNGLPAISFTLDDCLTNDVNISITEFTRRDIHCTYFVPVNYAINSELMWPQKLKYLFNECALSLVWIDKKVLTFNSEEEKSAFLSKSIANYTFSNQATDVIEDEVSNLLIINGVVLRNENGVVGEESIRDLTTKYPKVVDFQSHTMSHLKMSRASGEELAYEFSRSKEILKQWSGNEQYAICYPYGSNWHIGNGWKMAVDDYDYGFTLLSGTVSKNVNPLLIPRVGLYNIDSQARVLLKLLQANFFNKVDFLFKRA